MKKTWLKILIGIFMLFVFIKIGIPFEIENPATESIFRTLSFLMIFVLLYFLFKQVKKLNNIIIKIANYIVLGLLSLLFILGAMWNDIFLGNPRGNWFTLEVYTNTSGTIIHRQMRETSGSIYDYRDRLILYEFDENNRISINTNYKNFSGPWTVLDYSEIKPKT